MEGIDKIYCINLERRPDRRENALIEFSKIDEEFEFFTGIDGSLLNVKSKIKPGHVGCVLSHLNLYKKIKEEDNEIVLITEDDVIFCNNFISKYKEVIKQVPDDWTLLYFGGNHNNLIPNMISKNVHRLSKTYTTHCYLVKKSKIDILIEEFDRPNIFNEEVDVHLSNIQIKYPCYGFIPHLAWQTPGYSDIENDYRDYNFLRNE
jgi:GR25 family glycosyltransferase involved in LPS biosynthesis